MNETLNDPWPEANQRYLMAALGLVRTALLRHARPETQSLETDETLAAAKRALDDEAKALPAPSALQALCEAFRLSSFERDVLLLCAGPELDARFTDYFEAADGKSRRPCPTFGLALAVLPDAHWTALSPAAPLRRWRLIELNSNEGLTAAALRIDERVLHYLTGVRCFDDRLTGLAEAIYPQEELPPSQLAVVQQIAGLWRSEKSADDLSVVQLCGPEAGAQRDIAAAACHEIGLRLHAFRSSDIPAGAAERESLARLWEREAMLSNTALFIDAEEADRADNNRTLVPFLENVHGITIVSRREPLRLHSRLLARFDIKRPAPDEQRVFWERALGDAFHQLNGQLDNVIAQFNLGSRAIRAVAAELAREPRDEKISGRQLWERCRSQARSRLDDLVQRIEAAAGWEDLVLPEAQQLLLREIATHVRNQAKVYQTWGFAEKSSRGLGISALFTGGSGTGKTMAAEVLATELNLDLYRIDLSSVVSKYIGETEKNLRRVFDAAEESGAILLFDEADALFGKRSEVKDSHDRYANIEVSYLLQRMEAYRGLAILTTNMKEALDTAFLRRIRFVIQFPFPDAALRGEIWRRIFPEATPTRGLDRDRLSRLNVAGGNIRNIALSAAFLAAESNEPVGMKHLLQASRSEYAKLEKVLTEAETQGWL